MLSLAAEFESAACFRVVYIAEAHATDEWPISSARCNGGRGPVHIAQPKTADDRIAAARAFQTDFGMQRLQFLVRGAETAAPRPPAPMFLVDLWVP